MQELIAGLAASLARALVVLVAGKLAEWGFAAGDIESISAGITALIVAGVVVAWRHVAKWLAAKAAKKG